MDDFILLLYIIFIKISFYSTLVQFYNNKDKQI